MTAFDIKFNKFKELKDKFESQFMIICYDLLLDDLKDKVKHQIELIKLVKDNVKRHYLLNKIFNFRNFLDNLQERKKINSVFLIHHDTSEILLEDEWINILNK